MKPFNLEEALAGKPVVTRKGKQVTQLHLFDSKDTYTLFGVIDRCVFSFPKDGKHFNMDDNDLFMATEKKTVWIGVKSGNRWTTYARDTKEEAINDMKSIWGTATDLQVIQTEIEV